MKTEGFNRRLFMKGVSSAALIGTLGSTSAVAGGMGQNITMSAGVNFDEGFNRVGTNSIKFDMIKMFNPGKQLDVGMGIADMDFRTLPEVTAALN